MKYTIVPAVLSLNPFVGTLMTIDMTTQSTMMLQIQITNFQSKQ